VKEKMDKKNWITKNGENNENKRFITWIGKVDYLG
jgi:hypothetical protein